MRNGVAQLTLRPELNLHHPLGAAALPDGTIILLKIITILDDQAHFVQSVME